MSPPLDIRAGGYRTRLAPSPTGHLHVGHARTFWTTQARARERGGTLILRNEDLDGARCKPEFVEAMFEDLRWFGFQWQEGPDCGGPCGPYTQSERREHYVAAFGWLRQQGFVYPCACSRRDVLLALQAPHQGDEEPVYPGTCRPAVQGSRFQVPSSTSPSAVLALNPPKAFRDPNPNVNWRFRVPDGETIDFEDGHFGPQHFVAGVDFGDFVVWRSDDLPAYQLAVVVDDAAMKVTEVVRGADLLLATARQLLLYRALGWEPPAFHHCPLMRDAAGVRLAKRHAALSLRTLREEGRTPGEIRASEQFAR